MKALAVGKSFSPLQLNGPTARRRIFTKSPLMACERVKVVM